MSIRIHFNEAKLLESYEQLMDKVYLEYFVHPTEIPHYNLSEAEIAETSEYNAMCDYLVAQSLSPNRNKRKKTIHFYNQKYCNGLPRKRY